MIKFIEKCFAVLARVLQQFSAIRSITLYTVSMPCMYIMYVWSLYHTYSKSEDRPGKVANPARGQLNRGNEYFPVPVRAWEFGLARRVRQSHPALACSLSILRLNMVLTNGIPPEFRGGVHFMKPPYVIGLIPSLSGHAIAYRLRSLPKVRRHRASKP